jgi:hypothetical protein
MYAMYVPCLAGAIILPLIVFGVPESHPYWTLARLQQRDPACAEGLKEAAAIRAHVPRFKAPWYPYQILLDRCVRWLRVIRLWHVCCCAVFARWESIS